MKANEIDCEKSSITYQPCYKAGKFTLIMISIILIGFLSVALYIFFDATQHKTSPQTLQHSRSKTDLEIFVFSNGRLPFTSEHSLKC